jgi:hypothetical protein
MKHRSSLPALACVGGGILCVAIGAGVRPAGGVAASPSLRLTEAEMSLIRGFDGGGCSSLLAHASNDCGWNIPAPTDCDDTDCQYCDDTCTWVPIIDTGGTSNYNGRIVSRNCGTLGSTFTRWPCTATEPCECDRTSDPISTNNCTLSTLEVIFCAGT